MDARALEGIEGEQRSLRVNGRTRHGKFGWNVSPSIERASASHEKKKAPKPIAAKQPRAESVANPPTLATCIARPVTGYKGLVETCRQRAIEMAISRLELDRLAGLPSGYSAKLLGNDDGVPRKKKDVARFPRGDTRHARFADHHH